MRARTLPVLLALAMASIGGFQWIDCCAAAFDGGLWMFSNLGVLRSSPEGGRPIRIA